MPIQGLTTRGGSFFELGVIRKGGAKTDPSKPGPDLDYLRLVTADREAAEAFKKIFGDKPRAIDFVVPFQTLEENFEAWREEYRASGLQHRCDGETCVQWRDEKGKMQFTPKPCPTPTDEQRKKGGCKQVCRMKIIIPALKRFAYITVTSTSIYDIISLHGQLLGVQLANDGNLRGVPLTLRRTEREISTPDKDGKRARRKKWLLSIEPHQSWVEKKLLEQHSATMGLIEAAKAPLMIETNLPAEVDDENDEVHEGEVIEDQAFDRKATLEAIYKGFGMIRERFGVAASDIEARAAAATGGITGEFEEMEDEQLAAILTSLRSWFAELEATANSGGKK